MYSDGRSRDPRASVQACFFMRKPPVAMSAEDSKWHGCAPQGGPHVRWPCEALSKSAGGTQSDAEDEGADPFDRGAQLRRDEREAEQVIRGEDLKLEQHERGQSEHRRV